MDEKAAGSRADRSSGLAPLVRLFFRLGLTGFGGPAAHIAMMEEEVVSRRGWLDRDHFLDLVGATNLIPGPNSTEMAIHIGYIHAGIPGLIAAGAAFILPAFLITTALAWSYVRFGSLPQVAPFLVGIKPAVIAIILNAVLQLGRRALKGWQLGVVGLLVLCGVMVGLNEMLSLLGGAIVGMLWLQLSKADAGPESTFGAFPLAGGLSELIGKAPSMATKWVATLQAPVTLVDLAAFFLRIGAVLYGSGYVLVAFLEGELVHHRGWLTQAQLLDAISAGQFTPGPVLSTSAFIGFLLQGPVGAIVAAVAIFLPSFFFVLALNPLIPRLRQSPWAAAFLDGANISAVALMAAVTLRLGASTLTTWQGWLIGLLAAGLRLRWGVNPSLLVVGSGILGWLIYGADLGL